MFNFFLHLLVVADLFLISSPESRLYAGMSAVVTSKSYASPACRNQTLRVYGLFSLLQGLFDVLEALKQYFRSNRSEVVMAKRHQRNKNPQL